MPAPADLYARGFPGRNIKIDRVDRVDRVIG